MIGTHRIIEDDLLCVARRLKSLDPDYFVVENYRKKRLEVHNSGQRGGTLALVLPYRTLDERTVTHVLKTRAERRRRLLEEMEKENERLEKEKIERLVKKAGREVENELGKF